MSYKNKFTLSLRVAKGLYYKGQIKKLKTNVEATWKVLHEILNRNRVKRSIPSLFRAILQKFPIQRSKYFTYFGPNLASKIPVSEKSYNSFLPTWKVLHEILNRQREKRSVPSLFGAFDNVDHNILISKLERALWCSRRWAYMVWNRQQYVEFNGNRSESCQIKCRVLKGSILGPLLFLLYINDLCNVSKVVDFIFFADDTNKFFPTKILVYFLKS